MNISTFILSKPTNSKAQNTHKKNILKYLMLFLILTILFSFIIIFYHYSINTAINNVFNSAGLENTLFETKQAKAETRGPFTLSDLNLAAPISILSQIGPDNTYDYNPEVVRDYEFNFNYDGDFKKAVETERLSINLVIISEIEIWFGSGKTKTMLSQFKVFNKVLTAPTNPYSEHNWYETGETNLTAYKSGFSMTYSGYSKNTGNGTASTDSTENGAKHYIKDIWISYGTVINWTQIYDPKGSGSVGSEIDLKIPSVAFNDYSYTDKFTGSALTDFNVSLTATANLKDNYYFTGWNNDQNRNNVTVPNTHKNLTIKVKPPSEITYQNPDVLSFTPGYSQISLTGTIADNLYTYTPQNATSAVNLGPYAVDMNNYTVTNYYGVISSDLIATEKSPYSDPGTYYFKAVITNNETNEIVGMTSVIKFVIQKATPSLGNEIKELTIDYNETLEAKCDSYSKEYKPLCNGVEVVGSFKWALPNTVLTPGVNTAEYEFIFTPKYLEKYNNVTLVLPAGKIKINKGQLQIVDDAHKNDKYNKWDIINKITYGESLNVIMSIIGPNYLVENKNTAEVVDGSWYLYKGSPVYKDDYTDDIPLVSDSSVEYTLEFVPSSHPEYYDDFTVKQLYIVVSKANPAQNLKDEHIIISELTYGQSINTDNSIDLVASYIDSASNTIQSGRYYSASNISLATGAPNMTTGYFVWFKSGGTTVLDAINDAGTHEFTIRYIPEDLDNYNIAYIGNKNVTIKKASPTLATDVPYIKSNPITYGEPLANATFILNPDDNNNSVKNPHNAVIIQGNWMWYVADMQNKGIANINYPTVADGSGNEIGREWAVYFVPSDLKNYIGTPSETGCLIKTSYLKVNKANQKLYYVEIAADGTNIKKIDGKNEYTAKSNQGNSGTEIIIKLYTTAIEYVTVNSFNPVAISASSSNSNIASVDSGNLKIVEYTTVSSNLKELSGSYDGILNRLTEVTITVKVTQITPSTYATGAVVLYAYESLNPNYTSVSQSEITKITFKRESIINVQDIITQYYSVGHYDFEAKFESGNKVYNLQADNDCVNIGDIDGGIYSITFNKAGVVNLTITCDDYVIEEQGLDNKIEVNYFGVSKEVTLYIEKTPVIVKHKDITITYGDKLELGYTDFEFNEDYNVTKVDTINDETDINTLKSLFAGIVSDYNINFEYQVNVNYKLNLSSTTIDFGNYTLKYEPGTLTVEKKEIKVELNYTTLFKTYGDTIGYLRDDANEIVTLALVYSDNNNKTGINVWEYNDYDTQNGRINPAKGIVLPVILYNFDTHSVVGATCNITINLEGTGSNNYTFTLGTNNTASVTITKRSVLISAAYNGLTIEIGQENEPEILANAYGYTNATLSNDGIFTYMYANSITGDESYQWLTWSEFTLIATGSVAVKITFTPINNTDTYKNYETTTVIKNNIMQMALAIPIISFNDGIKVYLDFTGLSFPQSLIEGYINTSAPEGVNQEPKGKYEIKFKSGAEGSFLDITNVLQVGVYNIFITFVPDSDSVYDIVSNKEFPDLLEVKPAAPGISMDYTEVSYGGYSLVVDMNTRLIPFYGYDLKNNTVTLEYREFAGEGFSLTQPTNVGYYDIKVTFNGDGYNYKECTIIFPSYLRITPYSFKEDISSPSPITVDYSGKSPENIPIVEYSGMSGGSTIDGKFTYKYRTKGTTAEKEEKPVDAGSYDMLVTYTAGDNDNYESWSKWFDNIITINQIEVIIKLVEENKKYYYSGNAINYNAKDNIYALSKLDNNLQIKNKAIIVTYLADGTDEYSESIPVNAGDYSIQVVFTPDDNNYKTTTAPFSKAITISKFSPIITFQEVSFDYDEVINDDVIISLITITKAAHDVTIPTPKQYIILLTGAKKEDNGTYTIVSSGRYTVNVTLVFDDNSNYNGSTKAGYINIRNITPEIVFVNANSKLNEVYYYTGVAVESKKAWPYIKENGLYAYGEMEYTYRKYGEGDSAWVSIPPVDVGEYDVKATYKPRSDGDNYSENSRVFTRNIEIRPMSVYIRVSQIKTKVYDGMQANISDINYVTQDINGDSLVLPDTAITQGSFVIGNGYAVNAGTYPIQLGDFNIISQNGIDNFTEQLITGMGSQFALYVIDKRLIEFEYSYTENIYANDDKSVLAIPKEGCIINSDEVKLDLQYTGNIRDATPSGFNVLIQSISGKDSANYYIEKSNENFKIIPAKITSGIKFEDIVVPYNGTIHTLELINEVEDSTVQFSMQNAFILPGSYTLTATVTKANYEDLVLSATMTITRSYLNITDKDLSIDNIDNLRVGQVMPRITVMTAEGSASFTEGSNLIVGTNKYEWEFTPSDPNYYKSTGKIDLTVKKALTYIIIDSSQGDELSEEMMQVYSYSGGQIASGKIRMQFTSDNGKVYEVIPTDPGTYKVEVTYLGDENHESTTYTYYYTIDHTTNINWIWAVVAIAAVLFGIVLLKIMIKRKKDNS